MSVRGAVVNMQDCSLEMGEFELQSHYHVHFRANTLSERYNPPP